MKRSKNILVFELLKETCLETSILVLLLYSLSNRYIWYGWIAIGLWLLFKHKSFWMGIWMLLLLVPLLIPRPSNEYFILEKRDESCWIEQGVNRYVLKSACPYEEGSLISLEGVKKEQHSSTILSYGFPTRKYHFHPKGKASLLKSYPLYQWLSSRVNGLANPEMRDLVQSVFFQKKGSFPFGRIAWLGLIRFLSNCFKYCFTRKQRLLGEIVGSLVLIFFFKRDSLFALFLFKKCLQWLELPLEETSSGLIWLSVCFFGRDVFSYSLGISLLSSLSFLFRFQAKEGIVLRGLLSCALFGSWNPFYSLGYGFYQRVKGSLVFLSLVYVLVPCRLIASCFLTLVNGFSWMESLHIGYAIPLAVLFFMVLIQKTWMRVILLIWLLLRPFFYHQLVLYSDYGSPIVVYHQGSTIELYHQGQDVSSFMNLYQKKYPFRNWVLINYEKEAFQFQWKFQTFFLSGKSYEGSLMKSDVLIWNGKQDMSKLIDVVQPKLVIYPNETMGMNHFSFLSKSSIASVSLQEEGGLIFQSFPHLAKTGRGNFVIMKNDE